MHAIHGTTTGVGGHGGEQCRVRDSEAHFLAFHVSAGLQRRCMLVGAQQKRISFGLCPIRRRHARKKQEGHRRPDRPAVALRSGHPAERVGQP